MRREKRGSGGKWECGSVYVKGSVILGVLTQNTDLLSPPSPRAAKAMSPPITLFLTTIASEPRLRSRQGINTVTDHSATSSLTQPRLEYLLRIFQVKQIPFSAYDMASDERARKLWKRKVPPAKQQLPGFLVDNTFIGVRFYRFPLCVTHLCLIPAPADRRGLRSGGRGWRSCHAKIPQARRRIQRRRRPLLEHPGPRSRSDRRPWCPETFRDQRS